MVLSLWSKQAGMILTLSVMIVLTLTILTGCFFEAQSEYITTDIMYNAEYVNMIEFGRDYFFDEKIEKLNTLDNTITDTNISPYPWLQSEIYEYVYLVNERKLYELFSVLHCDDFFDSWLVISEYRDAETHIVNYFNIQDRRRNAYAGLFLVDVDFDGVKDILVWLGREGNQGLSRYAAFLNRGEIYKDIQFDKIPNPSLNSTNQKIMGTVRSWAAGHYIFLYEFVEDEIVLVGSASRELCRDSLELRYVVIFYNGQRVNEMLWYEYEKEKIYALFYSTESRWELTADSWRNMGEFRRNQPPVLCY